MNNYKDFYLAFTTDAPSDAPETKGTTCYFKPEKMEWSYIFSFRGQLLWGVRVHGPSTRVDYRIGERYWTLPETKQDKLIPRWVTMNIPWAKHARVKKFLMDMHNEQGFGNV